MTDHNNAALAAEQDPLSDDYINLLIRQHGYDSPEAIIARLWQWIGLNGGENSVTLLIYEAHKALSKLRAEGVQAGDTLTQVYDAFGIGVLARRPSTLLACLGNVIRRANCLSQVEQVLSVPTPPEPEDDGVWGEESLLRWGADEKGYAEHFRAAMAEWSRRAALASAPVAEPYDSEKRCRAYYDSDLRPFAADGVTYDIWKAVWHAAQFDRAMYPNSSKRRPHSAPVAGESVCKGSMALGSGCGACERCKAELQTGNAPVAGEAYQGDSVAERLDNMADDQPPGSQAQSDLYAAATIWRKHIAHRAAPQASEAVRNPSLIDLLIRAQAWMATTRGENRPNNLIRLIDEALKTQADKDGGDCAKGESHG